MGMQNRKLNSARVRATNEQPKPTATAKKAAPKKKATRRRGKQ